MVNAVEPITLNPVADAYVDSSNPVSNYGGEDYLSVSFYDYDFFNDTTQNSYLLFDLSDISSDIYGIESATLELYLWSPVSPTVQVGVHSCPDTEWNELEITWSNAPSFSSEPLDVKAVAFGSRWYSWNVTEETKNSQGNYLTLVLAVEGGEGEMVEAWFASKDYPYSNNPKLVIQYTIIPEFPSWIILPLFLTATVLALVVRRRINGNSGL